MHATNNHAPAASGVDLDSLAAAKAEFDRLSQPQAFEPIRLTQKQLDSLREVAQVWEREGGGFASDHFRGVPIVVDEANPTFPPEFSKALG